MKNTLYHFLCDKRVGSAESRAFKAKPRANGNFRPVYINAGSAKVTKLYARVRAYKVDGDGQREYTEWSTAEIPLN